jgi:DNA helicase II / ATP-dependent DNA helicase PcrA
MQTEDYLDRLNDQQRAAVEHGSDVAEGESHAPLLVIAGAGSGKTNTLAHRVAYLIVGGASPERILLLTFSRRASAEMARRVERIVASALGAHHPASRASTSWAGTFHGIGARLLRQYGESIGVPPGFTILDRGDSADLVDLVRHELGFSGKQSRFPRKATCLAIYSYAVNAELSLEAVLAEAFPWCASWEEALKQLFLGYVEAKQRQGVLDYDDLLLYWAQMMQLPEVAADVAARFDHVLVDEYQDTNRLQASILMGLKPDGRGLTVVGDDAQAIYSFRAATVRNILDFPAGFNPPARIVTLARNYRSTQPILTAGNAVIAFSRERFTKDLHSERLSQQKPRLVSVQDEADQVCYVTARILANREAGIALKQQAVLFRTSHHSAALELELTRRNIPFVKFGGLKFLEAGHVKDLLALLRWAENPKDQTAGFRALQILPGIGPAIARRALDCVAGALSPGDALAGFRPPAAAASDWPAFADLFTRLQRGDLGWPAEMDRARDWLSPHLDRLYEDATVRAIDLEQMAAIATGYRNRTQFLTELTLDPPDATSDEAGIPLLDEDYLILSTIHSAKGQEWTAVYVLNVVDGCIPSDMAVGTAAGIEEERRLLYVAMTRAKDQLHLVLPHRFFTHQQSAQGDRHVYASRSRFIPGSILQHFDCHAWVWQPGTADGRQGLRDSVADIPARMRAMWR